MNAVEIAEAVAELVEETFDGDEFPYSFLRAFGNPDATIERLRSGNTNRSDIGGVLQRNNIHILTCDVGAAGAALETLRESLATKSQKAKFILVTDGIDIEAEDLNSGETLACSFKDLEEKFGFFLPLANITTVREIRESSFDIKATGRLNKLYVELLKNNPDWSSTDKRNEMNHFMARLIFCFFAEDTDIFGSENLLTSTIEKMSSRDASDVHLILSDIFKTMNTNYSEREEAGLPRWANAFPYVNGGMFSGSTDIPIFTKIARTYLLHIGKLDWTKINPDVFGSMLQAVADEEERGSLGMHYTSVPNIMRVLDPLFLNDLRQKLASAGDNSRKLLNIRSRLSKIRVFDPACGSGNFLVIAYKEMRAIEAEILARRNEKGDKSVIPITNFRGIEVRDFSAEIARLALIIAEFQCNVIYRGQREALADFLPLDNQNWITCGNALKINWLSVCPPEGGATELLGDDLFSKPEKHYKVAFKNEGAETYICGNPPYKGSNWRTDEQTAELGDLVSHRARGWKALDYVCGWFLKAADYCKSNNASFAFVATNSICQGTQAAILWPILFEEELEIFFAYTSFKWSNLAAHNAGVSVIIVGMSKDLPTSRKLYEDDDSGELQRREGSNINAYLLLAQNIIVRSARSPISFSTKITDGSGALDGGNLILTSDEKRALLETEGSSCAKFIKKYVGSSEFIKGGVRYCLWIDDNNLSEANVFTSISSRISRVREFRENAGSRAQTALNRPHKFAWINKLDCNQILVPTVFSERREYVTAGLYSKDTIINNAASIVEASDLSVFSIISSRLHMAWVRAIAGKLEDRIRYTSSTCYNTFPLTDFTEANLNDLRKSAANILSVRELHFPATIADLYDPDLMPSNLRAAHDQNDEIIERIYIGRNFKNDTERVEILFNLYTKITSAAPTN